MANVAKQIIGSFEDIGKDVVREAGKVPGDVVGKALESLGTSSQKGQKGNPLPSGKPDTAKQPEKPVPARQWLEELAGTAKKQKEPTVQERQEKDKQEKNEKEKKQMAKAAQMAPIQEVSTKPRRGNLWAGPPTERHKNIRQD